MTTPSNDDARTKRRSDRHERKIEAETHKKEANEWSEKARITRQQINGKDCRKETTGQQRPSTSVPKAPKHTRKQSPKKEEPKDDVNYLESIGITDKKSWFKWALVNHPDKNPELFKIVSVIYSNVFKEFE